MLYVFAVAAALAGCRAATVPPRDAATTPAPGAGADLIFDRYAEAVGGQEAVDRVKTLSLKGEFEMTGRAARLPVEVYIRKPDRALMVISVPGLGEIRRGIAGGEGWAQVPAVGVVEDSPAEITEVERDYDVYQAGRIRELYKSVSAGGRARLGGREHLVVEGRPARGPAEKMFFDAETGLLRRWDVARRRPGRNIVFAHVYLDDYREVDGVKVPFTVRYYIEPRFLTLRLHEVKHNVPLADAIFKRPAGR